MDLEIAEEASQLLKKKITLEQDLEKLLSKDKNFKIGINTNYKTGNIIHYNDIQALNISKDEEFNKKIKWLTILEVEKEIEKITNQIKDLKYC